MMQEVSTYNRLLHIRYYEGSLKGASQTNINGEGSSTKGRYRCVVESFQAEIVLVFSFHA